MKKSITTGVFLLSAAAMAATTYTWPGTSGGDITDPLLWGLQALPTSADQVLFNKVQSAPYCMNLLSSWTLARLDFKESCTLDLGTGKTLSSSAIIDFEGGKTYTLKSGTLESTGNRIFLGDSTVGNTLIVEGAGAVLRSAPASAGANSYVCLGQNNGNQRMVVRDGATFDGNLYMAVNANSGGNSALITDPGTKWTLTGDRQVRLYGAPDNVLVISNKASAVLSGVPIAQGENNEGSVCLGCSSASIKNRLVVTDGAALRTAQSIVVGASSSNNELLLSDGGYVSSGYGIQIGRGGAVTGNKLTVSGKGNGIFAKNGIVIGGSSCGSSLVVEPDAELAYGGSLVAGNSANASNNVMSIAGTMTVTNTSDVTWYFGANGPSNRFEVLSGGRFMADRTRFVLGHNGGSQRNALTVGPNAEFICKNSANMVGESSAWNVMTVSGGRTAFENNQLIVGANASAQDNLVEVKNGGTMSFDNTTVTIGESGPRSRLAVSGGSRLAFTNTNVIVGKNGSAKGSELSIEDSELSFYNGNPGGLCDIQVGVDGGSISNVLRFVRSRLLKEQARSRFRIATGTSASSRSVGNRVEILEDSVMKTSRFILGDYSKDTRLVLSNSILNVSGDFQANLKDLTDSGCEVHFYGTNLYMTANTCDFYGDTKYVFHVPVEGYTMTNAQKAVVFAQQTTIRSGAKAARAAGKKLIKVTAAPGARKGGRWTLMRIANEKWNFSQEGGITVDDIECDPGIKATVTANAIEVRVSSNQGCVLIVR